MNTLRLNAPAVFIAASWLVLALCSVPLVRGLGLAGATRR